VSGDAEVAQAVAEVLRLERHLSTLRKQLQEAEAHLQVEVQRLAKLGFQRAAPAGGTFPGFTNDISFTTELEVPGSQKPRGVPGRASAPFPDVRRRLEEQDKKLEAVLREVKELREAVHRLTPPKPGQPRLKPSPPDLIN
jgi:hypothetical protein